MELFWPHDLCPASSELKVLDNTGFFQSPLTGYKRTVTRPGSRLQMSLNFRNVSDDLRGQLHAMLARLRGADSVWMQDFSRKRRGSFLCPELLPNGYNYFPDGVDTWTSDSEYTLTAQDGVIRATRNAVTGSANLLNSPTLAEAVPYAPYVARAIFLRGLGTYTSGLTAFGTTGEQNFAASVFGYNANVNYPTTATPIFRVRDNQTSGLQTGHYVSIPFVSYARCGLVDNSSNLLLHSDDLTDSAWVKTRVTITNSSFQAPDGINYTTVAIHEDTSSATTHFVDQDVTVTNTDDDYTFSVALRRSNRTFARIMMVESVNGDTVSAYINLTTGAVTNVTNAGTNFTEPRAVARDLGNNWFLFSLTGRKSGVGTTLTARIYVAEAAGDITFTGGNQNSIIAWRVTLQKASVPGLLTQTVGSADSDGTEQSLLGGLNTKGWPVSTAGLLLPGDQVQIGQQLLIVAAPMNSDSAGRARLEVYPMLRESPADNEPVIVNYPMGKFMPDDLEQGWSNSPGFRSAADIVLGEVA